MARPHPGVDSVTNVFLFFKCNLLKKAIERDDLQKVSIWFYISKLLVLSQETFLMFLDYSKNIQTYASFITTIKDSFAYHFSKLDCSSFTPPWVES